MNKYRVAIANDHQGYEFKKNIILKYQSLYQIVDLGCHSVERTDYPEYANRLAEVITQREADFGILICGSGIGMSIAANRHSGIRAALCVNLEMAELARNHNDANVLVLGVKFVNMQLCYDIIERFITSDFAGGRHLERIAQLN